MKSWPEFNEFGDLPRGIHRATLGEIVRYFGASAHRRVIARRLQRIHQLAESTDHLSRFIVFGSFATAKATPNDVFLLMDDSFDVTAISAEARLVFDHSAAQNLLGASVFWVRLAAALGGVEQTVAHWQIKRDGSHRGIVEVVEYD